MQLGLTQWAVAKLPSGNAWTVLNWVRNKTQPGAKHLGRIAEFLGYFPLVGGDSFSDRIVETRQRLGLTQAGLGAMLGLAECTILNWERGRRHPRGIRLRELEDRIAEARAEHSSG